MKKVFSVLFLLSCMLVNLNAVAADCSKAIDVLCDGLSNVTRQVEKCSSVDQLERLDFDSAVNFNELSDLPEECLYAVLTPTDKSRLKSGFGKFFDTLSAKTYELCGGIIPKADIDAQFNPMKTQFNNVIDKAKDFKELEEMLQKF